MDKIAFLYPGQGAQHIGMGQILCEEFDIAGKTFEEASDYIGFDLKKICFEGSMSELNKLENMFCSILTCSVAAFRVYMKEIGLLPEFTAGHSLGEYSALTCSGAMEFSHALELVRYRSSIAQQVADGENALMAVVNGVNEKTVMTECSKICSPGNYVRISCYNSWDQFVIAGHFDALMKVQDILIDAGGQVTPLFMSPPFHSSIMKAAAVSLENELQKYTYNKLNWPVISNVFALPYENEGKIVEYLSLQMTQPVQWQATIDFIKGQGIGTIIEMGPQAVLANLMNSNARNIESFSFGQKDDRDKLMELFAKDIQDKNKDNDLAGFIGRCLAIAVATRNSNWNEEEYIAGVEQPYEKIDKIQNELDRNGEKPSYEQMLEAVEMLKSVFKTKMTPLEEQAARFDQLFDETNTRDVFKNFNIKCA